MSSKRGRVCCFMGATLPFAAINEDLQCDFPFLNYRRRHNIPKTKLHGEFVQKDRSSFPTGLVENSSVTTNDQKANISCDKGGKEQIPKFDLEILRRKLLQDGYRTKKRKAPLQLENAKTEMLQHEEKVCTFTNENCIQSSKGSQIAKNKLFDVPMKHTNSVFLEVQNICNSFRKDKPVVQFKSPSQLPFVFADGFKPGLERGEEMENVPKRSRMCHSTFVIPHEGVFPSPKAVQRVNASALSHFGTLPQDSFCSPSNTEPPAACSALTSKTIESRNKVVSVKASSFQSLENTFENDEIPKKIIPENIFALFEEKDSGNKGSNWVHSLPQALVEETEHEDFAKKRKIRNILPGGFAEQMLKLQRREKSERVIWKHKADQSKKKASTNSLCLVIAAITHMSEIVMVKCVSDSSSDVFHDLEGTTNTSALSSHRSGTLDGRLGQDYRPVSGSKYVIVLFKKSAFTKLHLKVKDAFLLYQPWQTLHVRSIPYPVILCAYFVERIAQTHVIIENETLEDKKLIEESELSTTSLNQMIKSERICSEDDLFWRGSVTVSARVQRVWTSEVSFEDFSIFKGAIKHFMYSVLLQTKEGSFHELILKFCSESIPNSWLKFLSGAEGRCYIFSNLHPSHRLHFKRHKDFFRILNSFTQYQKVQSGKDWKQQFCYQLMLGSKSEIPQKISEDSFPDFYPIVIQPLSQLLEGGAGVRRVSCLGKLLLKYKGSFYISDESLCHSGSSRYIQVQSLSSSVGETLQTSTVILIKEALFQEGHLLLDRYSTLQQLCVSSEECRELGLTSRIKQFSLVQLQNVIPPLNPSSQVSQLVSIRGNVISVDESKAFTWLQCSFCSQENLIQDMNLVIYCEDCSRVVPKPVLNVKMEVTLCCQTMPSAVVNVQLLSATIRHILQIDDNTYQPQCTVADVLGKTMGPLFCYVRNCEIICDRHFFHLSEIQSN